MVLHKETTSSQMGFCTTTVGTLMLLFQKFSLIVYFKVIEQGLNEKWEFF